VIELAAATGWLFALALVVELRRRAGLIRDAAHELRGPLTAISLGIEALRRQPAARRRAEALATELCRMEVAAEDVTAAARGRRARARPARLALEQLVCGSGEAWQAAAGRRGGRVTFDWRGGAAPLRADRRRLAQAFGNLLSNAVEHGGGEIVVRGRLADGGVRVEVEDRGAARPIRRPPGRGRGLSIASRALEQAGGRLVSFDRPDGGHVAVAELPVERPS
jgi:two-component system sensor histidine kinase MtrB